MDTTHNFSEPTTNRSGAGSPCLELVGYSICQQTLARRVLDSLYTLLCTAAKLKHLYLAGLQHTL